MAAKLSPSAVSYLRCLFLLHAQEAPAIIDVYLVVVVHKTAFSAAMCCDCYFPFMNQILYATIFLLQVLQGAGVQNYKLPDDVPSAPPLAGSVSETNQVSGQPRADFFPHPTKLDGSATADMPNTGNGTPLNSTAKTACDASLRYIILASFVFGELFVQLHVF